MTPRLSLACLALAASVAGCDDTRPSSGADAGPNADAFVPPGTDAGPDGRDGGGAGDDGSVGPGTDAGMAEDPDAEVDLTFEGCSPDFSGDVLVVRNADSIAVSSTSGGALTGSVQLALQDERGLVDLSTQHRVDTGAVINVVITTTWTNIAQDSAAVLSGEVADPIGGTLNVREYDEAAGRIDVEFDAATLQNPSDGTVCRVDGRLRTFRLSL